jgi:hypothetical protein
MSVLVVLRALLSQRLMRLWRSVTYYGITNYEIEGGKSIKVRKNVRKSISQYKHKEQTKTQD